MKRWRVYPHDADLIAAVSQSAAVPPIVAQLLLRRGISAPTDVGDFLDPKLSHLRDPGLLPGVNEAADRIFAAIDGGKRIVIYGDYDADGMTATAILYSCLKRIGGDVGYYVPNRMDDGYGLNSDALRKLAERGASLVVSVDCGITAVAQSKVAAEVGLELIITDHHEMDSELPVDATLVHPRLPGHNYPFGELCGAGVAFKLAWAVCQRASQSDRVKPVLRQFLLEAVGLAALGTVADVVPLVDENRVLVRHGLASLREYPVPGLSALLQVAKLTEKSTLTSEDLAFSLGPRLNAAGRLGQAQLGVELLVTDSQDRATSLAEYIHQLNDSRGSLERSIYKQASTQIKEHFDPTVDPALVVAGHGWHAGVIGIVAGRLAEKYHLPTVVISLDELGAKPGMGSARSACGLKLHEALHACSSHLVSHGGHAAAAGLKIDEPQVDAFRAAFCDYAASEISEQDRVAELDIDAETTLSQLNLRTVQQIEQLAPFGQGNPRPALCTTEVQLVGEPKRMGGGDRHLSLQISQHQAKIRGVAFGKGDWAEELAQIDSPIDIAYRPVINEFRGRRNVEIHLLDWRPSQATVKL